MVENSDSKKTFFDILEQTRHKNRGVSSKALERDVSLAIKILRKQNIDDRNRKIKFAIDRDA